MLLRLSFIFNCRKVVVAYTTSSSLRVGLSSTYFCNGSSSYASGGASFSSGSTVDEKNLNRFRELCKEWWKENGQFRALLAMNQLRVPWIRDTVMVHQLKSMDFGSKATPLRGLSVLDVGCGGGFLSEALARLGASVTGLDAEQQNVDVAEVHKSFDKSIANNLRYVCNTVEGLLAQSNDRFDVLVASEVVEHVSHVPHFVKACVEIVNPGGLLFFTTINRTFLSWVLAIQVAENVFGIVPKGVHDWNKFVTPDELTSLLQSNGCKVPMFGGITINPLTNRWSWISSSAVNYALYAVKNES